MVYYYPSCNFTALFPELAQRIGSYLRGRGVEVLGCCRRDHSVPQKGDESLYVCTNCGLILREVGEAEVLSLAEFIARAPAFPLPDLRGRSFVIQHCAKGDKALGEAVCGLVRRAGGSFTVSPEENYCGTNFMKHMTQRNLEIAPRTFSQLEKRVRVLDEAEQEAAIRELMGSYPPATVLTYCNGCYSALKKQGAEVLHLMELLFPAPEKGVGE